MTLSEVHELEANAALNQWEEINQPDDLEGVLIEAGMYAGKAADSLAEAIMDVEQAADALDGHPLYDRLIAVVNDMEDVLSNIRYMRDRFNKGELL